MKCVFTSGRQVGGKAREGDAELFEDKTNPLVADLGEWWDAALRVDTAIDLNLKEPVYGG